MTTQLIHRTDQLELLVAGVRDSIGVHADWQDTAELVADQLRAHLPDPAIAAAGGPLYVEPDGSFSIVAVVWPPGHVTPIHDHTTWCVFGVVQGVLREDVFDSDLNLIGHDDGVVGNVNGFAPPGDIH